MALYYYRKALICKLLYFLCHNTDCTFQDAARDLQRDSKRNGHRVHSVQPSEFSHLFLLVGRQTGNFQIAAFFFHSASYPHKHTGNETTHYLHMKVHIKLNKKSKTFWAQHVNNVRSLRCCSQFKSRKTKKNFFICLYIDQICCVERCSFTKNRHTHSDTDTHTHILNSKLKASV